MGDGKVVGVGRVDWIEGEMVIREGEVDGGEGEVVGREGEMVGVGRFRSKVKVVEQRKEV